MLSIKQEDKTFNIYFVKGPKCTFMYKSITQPNDNKNLKDIKKQVSVNVKLEKHTDVS